MRKEDLYQAIGELDEKLLAKSEAGWRPSRVFRTALTAAACLLLAAGIGTGVFFGMRGDSRGEALGDGEDFVIGSEEQADSTVNVSDQNNAYGDWNRCDMLLSDNILYFSTYTESYEPYSIQHAGVFLYDPTENSTLRLGEFPAAFTEAQSGDYCTDTTTGDIYELEGHSMRKVGALPWNEYGGGTLIDVLGDTIYYSARSYEDEYGFAFFALDTASGETRELYRCEDRSFEIQDCYLRDGVIYYRTANPEFYALDLNTGENRLLDFRFPEGALYHISPCAYFDDCIIIDATFYDDDSGYNLYRLDYDTLEVTRLSRPENSIMVPICRTGDTLYWEYSYFYLYTSGEVDEPYGKVAEYDLVTGELTEREEPVYSEYVVAGPGGYYYDDNREDYPGLYFYDISNGQTHRIDIDGEAVQGAVETVSPVEAQPEAASAEPSEESFFALFHELDEASVRAYLDDHPEALDSGWGGIDINASGLEDAGTDIRTTNGDQVLAVNARDGILLVRVEVESPATRGVLAICKDTSQLRLCASENLGESGQTAGEICEANGGVLAMTGSAFIDANSDGNGGQLSGLMVSGGEVYGTAMGAGYKRLELREDDRMYIVDSANPVGDGTRDAVEFQPAVIVDGEVIRDTGWNGISPRALIGQSDRLETMMLVMEGRFTDSVGCGVEECAEIMQKYGCVQAMNLDGGTSAIMYYKGECVTRCSNPDLSDGRQLPSAWVYGKIE